MITPTDRAEGSKVTFSPYEPQIQRIPALKQVDTLADGEEKSAWAGLGGLALDFLSQCWEWIKYNLIFCIFDEGEENRMKFIEELEVFVNKTPFGQQDPDKKVELENQKDFLPAFKKLSQEIQDGVLEEMIVILKKIEFDIQACKKNYNVKTEDEAYKKFAEALLEFPYEDIEDLASSDDVKLGSHIVVLEAIKTLDLKLRSYESY